MDTMPIGSSCGTDNDVGEEIGVGVVIEGTTLGMAVAAGSDVRADRVLIWVTVSYGNENRPARKMCLHIANDTSGVTIFSEQACCCSCSV